MKLLHRFAISTLNKKGHMKVDVIGKKFYCYEISQSEFRADADRGCEHKSQCINRKQSKQI